MKPNINTKTAQSLTLLVPSFFRTLTYKKSKLGLGLVSCGLYKCETSFWLHFQSRFSAGMRGDSVWGLTSVCSRNSRWFRQSAGYSKSQHEGCYTVGSIASSLSRMYTQVQCDLISRHMHTLKQNNTAEDEISRWEFMGWHAIASPITV